MIKISLFENTKIFISALLISAIPISSPIFYAQGKINPTLNQHRKKLKIQNMKTLLIIGVNPFTIDFTNPELPKGLTPEAVEKGTQATVEKLKVLGYEVEIFLINAGSSDLSKLEDQLMNKRYAGVLIGNGIRSIASNFILFEQIVNVVHANAPKAKIIFNTLPTDTEEAVKRWM